MKSEHAWNRLQHGTQYECWEPHSMESQHGNEAFFSTSSGRACSCQCCNAATPASAPVGERVGGNGGGGGGGDFPGADTGGGGGDAVDDLGGEDEPGGADLTGEPVDFEEPGEEPEA